jgi:hypothetical protein
VTVQHRGGLRPPTWAGEHLYVALQDTTGETVRLIDPRNNEPVRTGWGFERLVTFAEAMVAIALTLLVLPLWRSRPRWTATLASPPSTGTSSAPSPSASW